MSKKSAKMGLRPLLQERPEDAGKTVRSCMALPFLPANKIEDGFQQVRAQAARQDYYAQLQPFLDYVEKTWINGKLCLLVIIVMPAQRDASESAEKVGNPSCRQGNFIGLAHFTELLRSLLDVDGSNAILAVLDCITQENFVAGMMGCLGAFRLIILGEVVGRLPFGGTGHLPLGHAIAETWRTNTYACKMKVYFFAGVGTAHMSVHRKHRRTNNDQVRYTLIYFYNCVRGPVQLRTCVLSRTNLCDFA